VPADTLTLLTALLVVTTARASEPADGFTRGLAVHEGDVVQHSAFGRGVVESLATSKAGHPQATVDFGPQLGRKRLVLRYAPLKIIKRA